MELNELRLQHIKSYFISITAVWMLLVAALPVCARDNVDDVQNRCLPQRFSLKFKVVIRHPNSGLPDNDFTLSISGRDGKMCFERGGTMWPHKSIYDGKYTYTVENNERRIYMNKGLAFGYFQDLSLPAVGLPSLPLIRFAHSGSTPNEIVGDVYTGLATSDGPIYLPGHIVLSRAGASEVAGANVEHDGTVLARWDFMKHTMLGKISMASLIHKSAFSTNAAHGTETPSETATYTLVSASLNAPGEDQFDPIQVWLSPTTDDPTTPFGIQWNAGDDTVAFAYQRGKSLEAQRDEALAQKLASRGFSVHRAKKGEISRQRPDYHGATLLGILLLLGGWWYLRIRKARRNGRSCR
jgi:hypothetical protein